MRPYARVVARLQPVGTTIDDSASGTLGSGDGARKQRGDFPTPAALVELVVGHTVAFVAPGTRVRVVDPACGDGRFLLSVGRCVRSAGAEAELVGMDIDAATAATARRLLAADGFSGVRIESGDALARDWGDETFDVVVGNPPYLSQLAASTTRGRASGFGGGPYADACAEFLALAVRLARPSGGRIGLVLPQSILASRDAGPIRDEVDRVAEMTWSWWSPARHFDADVLVCALAFERRDASLVAALSSAPAGAANVAPSWSRVVTAALGVPELADVASVGTLGDRARVTANFRDQYYGLVPAVADDVEGPPLVTSGLVDPGRCRWGERSVTFAKQRHAHPRVALDRLAPLMRRWAAAMLVPKVLVANQTRVIEAVADLDGAWLPGVPLITVRPPDHGLAPSIAAVLTSPVASAWAWHRAAGTGLSAQSLRLGPRWLSELPWPAGSVHGAVAALAAGDVAACGVAVTEAYGIEAASPEAAALLAWWSRRLPDA